MIFLPFLAHLLTKSPSTVQFSGSLIFGPMDPDVSGEPEGQKLFFNP